MHSEHSHQDQSSESEPIREKNTTPNASQKSETQANQCNPNIPITSSVPALPPAETHYEIACKKKKDAWDKFKEGAEVLGIATLVVYTIYTIKMYRANKEAADAAKSAADTA